MLYSAASLLINRYAMRQDQRMFLLLVLGGMIVRMLAVLLVVVMVLLLLPVEQVPFITSFLAVFLIGMIVEVLLLHRKGLAAMDT